MGKVSTVMTKDPMTLPPETMVLDALKEMLNRGYLHMPIKDGSRIVGLVDVMELVTFIMDDGGKEFWQEAGAHGKDGIADAVFSRSTLIAPPSWHVLPRPMAQMTRRQRSPQ